MQDESRYELRNWHQTWATYLAAAICVAVFLRLFFAGELVDDVIEQWGWRPAGEVWGGDWWALITSAFVHLAIWHVAFNVYWLAYLGRPLERALGPWRWWLLVLVSAFVSSTCQMAVSDEMGIGISGVIYALFGFMWVAKRRWPEFTKWVDQRTAGWLFGWLLLCFVLTFTGVWNVGNWAHLSGLVFGACAGASVAVPRWRRLSATAAAVILAGCVGVLFRAPWSPAWTAEKAYAAHHDDRLDDALEWYRRCLELEPDSVWAWHGIGLIHYERGETAEYDRIVEKLHKLDPDAAQELEQLANEDEPPDG